MNQEEKYSLSPSIANKYLLFIYLYFLCRKNDFTDIFSVGQDYSEVLGSEMHNCTVEMHRYYDLRFSVSELKSKIKEITLK